MRLGTFVGQESINLSGKEIAFVSEAIKRVMNTSLPNVQYTIEKEETPFGCYFTIKMFGNGKQNYRNKYGDLVCPKKVLVSLYKQIGYDEAKEGKFYEWEKGYSPTYDIESYSFNINVYGDERGYRKQLVSRNVGIIPTIYTYGTELDDLEVSSGLWDVIREIKTFRPCKKNII